VAEQALRALALRVGEREVGAVRGQRARAVVDLRRRQRRWIDGLLAVDQVIALGERAVLLL